MVDNEETCAETRKQSVFPFIERRTQQFLPYDYERNV